MTWDEFRMLNGECEKIYPPAEREPVDARGQSIARYHDNKKLRIRESEC
jgi:hypothetical protein